MIRTLQVAIAVILALFISASCTGKGEAQKSPKKVEAVNVRVLRVAYKEIENRYKVSGILQGVDEALVTSAISGRISILHLNEGDRVATGQVVARIDPADYKLALKKAEAVLDGKKKNFERINELYIKKAVPKAQYDVAETELKLADTSLEEATLNLARTNIKSPISGEAVRKYRILGDRVIPGTPLYKIVDTSMLKLVAAISEREVVHIKTNDTVKLFIYAYPKEAFEGLIRSVRFSDKPGVASFPVEIVLKGHGKLKPGMVARAALRGEVFSGLLLVPSEALIERMGLFHLFVYDKGYARLRQVEVGRKFGELSEIIKGLSPGEYIIPSQQSSLSDGAPVNVIDDNSGEVYRGKV
ncbi:MAG: efflux RND transporter periplasmic adaptor subunit [Nitrospinota bacterium]